MAAIWLAARGQARRPAAQLLARGAEREIAPLAGPRVKLVAAIGGLSLLGALVLSITRGRRVIPACFSAQGSAADCRSRVQPHTARGMARARRAATTLGRVGMRGAARLPGRSLATVGVLASGVFMIVSVSAFRHDPHAHALERSSGTGGFAPRAGNAAGLRRPQQA